ncbi:MAG: DUF1016 N-terminal domain-containing protein [bacterium]
MNNKLIADPNDIAANLRVFGQELNPESYAICNSDMLIKGQDADYIKFGNSFTQEGFTYRGLYRMRQFYETYHNNKFVSPLVTQISWTNHLIILSKTKTNEEKEFYIRLSIKENYSKRELERQIDSGYYERVMLSKKKVSPAVTQIHHDITNAFKDTYILDFLNLPIYLIIR